MQLSNVSVFFSPTCVFEPSTTKDTLQSLGLEPYGGPLPTCCTLWNVNSLTHPRSVRQKTLPTGCAIAKVTPFVITHSRSPTIKSAPMAVNDSITLRTYFAFVLANLSRNEPCTTAEVFCQLFLSNTNMKEGKHIYIFLRFLFFFFFRCGNKICYTENTHCHPWGLQTKKNIGHATKSK